MTRLSSIKYIIWGADTPDLTNDEICELLEIYGYTDTIKFIAQAQLNKILKEPNSINDGANTISWQDRVKGLENIINLCNKQFYRDPEAIEEPKHQKTYTLDTTPKEFTDYWGRSWKDE